MKIALAAGSALLLLAACASDSSQTHTQWRRESVEFANQGMSDWANVSSNLMVEKYGPPDRVETLRLVWAHRGPWLKILVWDGVGFLQNGGSNNLEEMVSYQVPENKREALQKFNRAIYVSPDGSELSARSTGEDRNILMLNLADQIIRDEISPEEARVVYSRTIELAESGKASPLMQRLMFETRTAQIDDALPPNGGDRQ